MQQWRSSDDWPVLAEHQPWLILGSEESCPSAHGRTYSLTNSLLYTGTSCLDMIEGFSKFLPGAKSINCACANFFKKQVHY